MEKYDHFNMYSGEDLELFLKEKIDRLLNIIPELRALYSRGDYRFSISGLEDTLKQQLTITKILAGTELNAKGKQKHSNEAQREVRAFQILKEDATYEATKEELKTLKDKQFDIEVERKALGSEIDVLKTIIPAITIIYERETLKMQLKELKSA